MNIVWLMSMVNKYGGKIQSAWPHLVHAWEDMQHVVVIFNDGKPLMMAGPLSPEADKLVNELVAQGVDMVEAEEFVRKLDEADKMAA
jgi:hypothetical protein